MENTPISLDEAEQKRLLLEFEIDKIKIKKKGDDDEISLTLVSEVVIVCKGRALALLSTRGGISPQNEGHIMDAYKDFAE